MLVAGGMGWIFLGCVRCVHELTILGDLFTMSDERAPRMMSFISEKELEEVKRKRQEEWEKARKPNDPVGECINIIDKHV